MTSKTRAPPKQPEVVALRTPALRISALTIAEHMARSIEEGWYAPGERIREQELAERFGCSRTPVREALRILESQALVVIEPMCGARVVKLDDSEFHEVFLLRRAVGSVVARRAAEGATVGDREEFLRKSQILVALARGQDDQAAFDAQVGDLLEWIREMSPGTRSTRMLRSLSFGRVPFRTNTNNTRRRRIEVAKNWLKLAQSILAGDGPAAEAIVRDMYDVAFVLVEEHTGAATGALAFPG